MTINLQKNQKKIMLKRLQNFYVLVLALLLSSCANIDIFKEKTEFKPYKRYNTFVIINQELNYQTFNDSFFDGMVSTTLQEYFEKQGMVYDRNNPELIIRFTSNEDKREREVFNNQFPMWGWRVWDPWFDPFMMNRFNTPSVSTRNYELMQLIVDFIDPNKDKVLMRLTAVSEVGSLRDKKRKLLQSVEKVGKTYDNHIKNKPD